MGSEVESPAPAQSPRRLYSQAPGWRERLSGVSQTLGGGMNIRLAQLSPPIKQRLRVPAGDERSVYSDRNDPDDVPTTN